MGSQESSCESKAAELLLFFVSQDQLGQAAGGALELCAGQQIQPTDPQHRRAWACAFSTQATRDFVAVFEPSDLEALWKQYSFGLVFGPGACLYWRWMARGLHCALLCEPLAETGWVSAVGGDSWVVALPLEPVAEEGAQSVPLVGLGGPVPGSFWEARIPRPIKYGELAAQRGQRPVLRAVCYRIKLTGQGEPEKAVCEDETRLGWRRDDALGCYWTKYEELELLEGEQ